MPSNNQEANRILGAKIHAARRKASLSQEALAEELGVKQSSVSQWERGHTRPSLAHLVPLATALGVSLDDLLSQVDDG